MNKAIGSVVFMLVSRIALPGEPAQLSATDFVNKCSAAMTKGDASTFSQVEEGLGLRHQIKLFQQNGKSRSALNILALIEKGTDTDIVVPRITAICIDGQEKPPKTTNGGDIEFSSNQRETIRFHMVAPIPHTTWKIYVANGKTTANESVWMVESNGSSSGRYPNRGDWPKCMPPKHVDFSADQRDIWFELCANSVGADVNYAYELHLDQTSLDESTVDIGIDPIIINHPP